PAGEERPHGSLVIAHAVVDLLFVGNVAQAPVGVERVLGALTQAAIGVGKKCGVSGNRWAAPPGESRINRGGAVERTIGVAAEGVALLLLIVELRFDGFLNRFGAVLCSLWLRLVVEQVLDLRRCARS